MKKIGFNIPTILLASILLAGSCQTFKDHKQARLKLKERKNQDITIEEEPEIDSTTVNVEELNGDSLFFYYEKTPCFGRCPIFKMSVYHSGFATYDGINFVENIGYHKSKISSEQVESIKELLNNIDFFSLQDKYDNENIMDIPAKVIEARYNGHQKRVLARYNAPEPLREAFKEIDKLFENTEWTPYSSN